MGAIANSLVFDVGGKPLLVLTSGAHRVEESLVATLLGVPADLPRARRSSSAGTPARPIGGVAPIGHPEPIGTLVDIELARHEQVWAAAGHPHTVFPTTYDELLRLTGGTPAEVGPGPVDRGGCISRRGGPPDDRHEARRPVSSSCPPDGCATTCTRR